jgi:hypothetical protein
MVAPLLVTPSTWHDETRFTDLALTDGICTQCFAPIGWQHEIWNDYWVTDEDMETAFCPQCYENLTKETV